MLGLGHLLPYLHPDITTFLPTYLLGIDVTKPLRYLSAQHSLPMTSFFETLPVVAPSELRYYNAEILERHDAWRLAPSGPF